MSVCVSVRYKCVMIVRVPCAYVLVVNMPMYARVCACMYPGLSCSYHSGSLYGIIANDSSGYNFLFSLFGCLVTLYS